MSQYTEMVDALETVVSGLVAPEPVYHFERVVKEWATFLKLFTALYDGHEQVRGWWLSREGDDAPQFSDFDGGVERGWNFILRGIRVVRDAEETEIAFQETTDALITTLDAQHQLGAPERITVWKVGPSWRRVIDLRMFGNVLCHYTEIVVPVSLREQLPN